jgi:abequosyltransferase
MISNPLLSICIPTFNREKYLRECLNSIVEENINDQFEVVISNNASTDKTIDVVSEFEKKLPIKVISQESNIGPDRNFDAVISAANGKYCWLLGDDDVIKPGALKQLLGDIQVSYADIIHFGYTQGDINLLPLGDNVPPSVFINGLSDELANYFSKQKNMSLLFTFISSYTFKRDLWMCHRQKIQQWFGTFYIQMFAMHLALANGASLYGVSKCYVIARGNNPTLLNSVPGMFIHLDATTLKRLINQVYHNSELFWNAFALPFSRSYTYRGLIYVAANGGIHYLTDIEHILRRLGYSRTFLLILYFSQAIKLLGIVKFALTIRRIILNNRIRKF